MERYVSGQNCVIMTVQQVRNFDAWAINTLGIPGVVLMENAGRSCAELIKQKLSHIEKPKVSIFCGTGNNGGDGFVIARHLLNLGLEVKVIICGDKTKIKGDAKINLDILQKTGQPVDVIIPPDIKAVDRFCRKSDMLVDAIFGTGLSGELKDDYKQLIAAVNSQDIPILAVDIPSGLDCDTAKVLGEAIKAACTVTFAAVKKGFALSQASNYTGDVYVASIGIDTAFYLPKEPGCAD